MKRKDAELAAFQDETRWQGQRIEALAQSEANLQVMKHSTLKRLSTDVQTQPAVSWIFECLHALSRSCQAREFADGRLTITCGVQAMLDNKQKLINQLQQRRMPEFCLPKVRPPSPLQCKCRVSYAGECRICGQAGFVHASHFSNGASRALRPAAVIYHRCLPHSNLVIWSIEG